MTRPAKQPGSIAISTGAVSPVEEASWMPSIRSGSNAAGRAPGATAAVPLPYAGPARH